MVVNELLIRRPLITIMMVVAMERTSPPDAGAFTLYHHTVAKTATQTRSTPKP